MFVILIFVRVREREWNLELEEMRTWKSGETFSWALFVHCVCLVCEGFVSRGRMGFSLIWLNDKLYPLSFRLIGEVEKKERESEGIKYFFI